MNYLRPAIVVLLALAALLLSADQASATTFSPTATACLDSRTTLAELAGQGPGDPGPCDGDSAPGAATSVTTTFNLPEGDANFAAVVNFIPPEWGVPAGDEIPDAAIVGQLNPLATLGLLSGACSINLFPVFILLDATTDNTGPQVTFVGSFQDTNADGVQDGVTKYPDFLNRIFDNTKPHARLFAHTVMSGLDVTLNSVIFPPGTKIGDLETDPALGFPSVIVLANLGDPAVEPDPGAAATVISDFCSPLLTTTITFGTTQDHPNTPADEDGFTYRSNPQTDGAYNFVTYAASQLDADDDGIENPMDPCPWTPDPSWDPRFGSYGSPQAGDSDGDRIPDSCDETVDTPIFGWDTGDGDGYANAGDNCPQVANGLNEDNQADADGDGIGDACDGVVVPGNPNGDGDPNVRDGHLHVTCITTQLTIGAGGVAPPEPNVCTEIRVGIDLNNNGIFDSLEGGADTDGDGVPDTNDNCPAWPNSDQSMPPWPVTLDGSDSDCDGWSTADENLIGTDPLLACGVGAWPPDFDDSLRVDIFDVNTLRPPVFFSTAPGPPYDVRFDLVPNGTIDIFDVNALRPPIFFATCTP
jgi:hypothetical protein